MIKGIYTAGNSLQQRTKNLDLVANNLANLNTIGYKREIPFQEYVDEYGNVQIKKYTDQGQGDIVLTSNPLDVAISGDGFFVVKDEQGRTTLTRDGKFNISEEGYLVDSQGNKVQGKNGDISLQETLLQKESNITISPAGELKVGDKPVDDLLIARVENPNDMERASGSNFLLNMEEVQAAKPEDFKISQGYLEESNTNPIVEMESMIQINKDFESTQKMIAAFDQSLEKANEIGKT